MKRDLPLIKSSLPRKPGARPGRHQPAVEAWSASFTEIDDLALPENEAMRTGLSMALRWDGPVYLSENTDLGRLRDAGKGKLLAHFLKHGVSEGRKFSRTARFSQRHAIDQATMSGAHMMVFGWSERPLENDILPLIVLNCEATSVCLVQAAVLTYWRNDVSQAVGSTPRSERHAFLLLAPAPAGIAKKMQLVLRNGDELIGGSVAIKAVPVDEFALTPLRLLEAQLSYEELVLVFREHHVFVEEVARVRLHALGYPPVEVYFGHTVGGKVELSVCAVLLGKSELLKPFMVSLLKMRPADSGWELLLLANAGIELENVRAAAQWCHSTFGIDVRVLSTQDNWGFGLGLNALVSAARGAVCMLTNIDLTFRALDLPVLARELRVKKTLVAAYQYNPSGSLQHRGVSHEPCSAMVNGARIDYVQTRLIGRNTVSTPPRRTEVDYFGAACFVGATETLRELGPFDGNYMYAYHEDCDLALRARKNGCKCILSPALQVVHYESSGSLARHMPLRAINAANLVTFMNVAAGQL
jgi:hypothetical protein